VEPRRVARAVLCRFQAGLSEGHDIVFYPDSGKVGTFAYDRYDLYRRKGAVDHWDGESPPPR
jgi:hypothetical protein